MLILGIGNGTKQLSKFLECTKSYEAVVLFGVESDSYDVVGKVVKRKPYEHVTRESVEGVLEKFRGRLMQRPPVFSALRVKGKRLYEYAREGKEVPVEIQKREVEVDALEVVEWIDGGKHKYHWPTQEVGNSEDASGDAKRLKSSPVPDDLDTEPNTALGNGDDQEAVEDPSIMSHPEAEAAEATTEPSDTSPCPSPAVRLKMTVTSGFYVRSLAHDLGLAVGSAGLMASLVRTRQGDFELGKNVLEYEDLEKGEEVWGEKVERMLKDWAGKKSEQEDD